MDFVVALIGFAGGLGGVTLGAWLNARASSRAEERRSRGATRAGARLVLVELRAAATAAGADAAEPERMNLNTIPREAWTMYQAALADGLTDTAFEAVSKACTNIAWAVTMNETPTMPVLSRTLLRELAEMCKAAQDELATFAYPGLNRGRARLIRS